MGKFIAGLAIERDHIALAVIEALGKYRVNRRYSIRHLERFKEASRGDRVGRILESMCGNHINGKVCLVVDRECGRPIIDALKREHPTLVEVSMIEDESTLSDINHYIVPKKELISNLQLLYIAERLRVNRELSLAGVFIKRLFSFRAKNNPQTTKGETHNDLVFAVALACWYGQESAESNVEFRRS